MRTSDGFASYFHKGIALMLCEFSVLKIHPQESSFFHKLSPAFQTAISTHLHLLSHFSTISHDLIILLGYLL